MIVYNHLLTSISIDLHERVGPRAIDPIDPDFGDSFLSFPKLSYQSCWSPLISQNSMCQANQFSMIRFKSEDLKTFCQLLLSQSENCWMIVEQHHQVYSNNSCLAFSSCSLKNAHRLKFAHWISLLRSCQIRSFSKNKSNGQATQEAQHQEEDPAQEGDPSKSDRAQGNRQLWKEACSEPRSTKSTPYLRRAPQSKGTNPWARSNAIWATTAYTDSMVVTTSCDGAQRRQSEKARRSRFR